MDRVMDADQEEEEEGEEEEREEMAEKAKRRRRRRVFGGIVGWPPFPPIDRMFRIVGLLAMLRTNCFFAQGFNVDDSDEEFCQWETFQAECSGEDEVMLVTKAFYGRLRVGRCVQREFGYINCGLDALEAVGQRCSGRRSCSFPVTVLHGSHQCPIDLAGYLIARHTCLRVTSCKSSFCIRSEPIKVPPSGGYLTSWRPPGGSPLPEAHCGSSNCPWTLEASHGQRLNLTLLDFSADLIKPPDGGPSGAAAGPGVSRAAGTSGAAGSICYRYASVRDGNLTKDLSGCGREGQGSSRRRSSGSYVSEGNIVQITIYTSHSPNVHFLIRYQTSGCPTVPTPPNARMKQLSEDLIVECLHSDRIWRLKCNGSAWIGHGASCDSPLVTSQGDEKENGNGSVDSSRKTSSLGVVIVVGLGIVIGIIIGFSMLVFLTCCIRRSRHSNGANHPGSPVYWKTRSELVYHGDLYHCDHASTMTTSQSPHDYGWSSSGGPDYKPRSPPPPTIFPPPSTIRQFHFHHHDRLFDCSGTKRLDDDDLAKTEPQTTSDLSDLDHCNALKMKDEEYERPMMRTYEGALPRENVRCDLHQQLQQQQRRLENCTERKTLNPPPPAATAAHPHPQATLM